MRRFFRQFKRSIIATGILIVVMMVTGLVILAQTFDPRSSNNEERAAKLGRGLAIATAILIAPFWIFDGYYAGVENRAELKQNALRNKSLAKSARKKPKQ